MHGTGGFKGRAVKNCMLNLPFHASPPIICPDTPGPKDFNGLILYENEIVEVKEISKRWLEIRDSMGETGSANNSSLNLST